MNDDMMQSMRDCTQFSGKDGELNREATRKGKVTTDNGRSNRIIRLGPVGEYRDSQDRPHGAGQTAVASVKERPLLESGEMRKRMEATCSRGGRGQGWNCSNPGRGQWTPTIAASTGQS